ncbi:unnamed protein product [Moneuplotes crassus]|uniref:Uncharacterized protein n=1 Tax=Euplotes crassus TaxID=5936 RepID=A0AAD1X7L2_EUPCR|nr:unnamed protein product [Moneuplotes crassus]
MDLGAAKEYTNLKGTVPTKKYNLAGVVIDATQPYKTSKNLIVTMKIVDPSISCILDTDPDADMDAEIDEEKAIKETNKMFRSISIFNQNQKDEMPIVKNVGDIILIKECKCAKFKGQEQFNINLHWHSEFMLFSSKELTDDEIRLNPEAQFFPYQMKMQSNIEFRLTSEEKNLIRELRIWSNTVFNPMFVYPDTMFDACAEVATQNRECDLHCKILEITSNNDLFAEVCVNDTSGCKLFFKITKKQLHQWDIQEGNFVRIRSIVIVKGTSNYIELTKNSHFLKFRKDSIVAKSLESKMKDDEMIRDLISSPFEEVILEHPITVSRTSDKYSTLHLVSLHDLFHNPESKFYAYEYSNYYDEYDLHNQSKFLRLRFNVLRTLPGEVEEIVQMYCEKCHHCASLKTKNDPSTFYSCSNCLDSTSTRLIYQMQFLIQDDSTSEKALGDQSQVLSQEKQFHRVLFYSHNMSSEQSGIFGGIQPSNLYNNTKDLESIRKYLILISKYNIYVEGIVELVYQRRTNPILMLIDCRLQSGYMNS